MNQEIIEEKYLEDYPIPITLENTEIIISQMQKSICKIYMDNGAKGTGFFCRVPYPDKNHYINCLVTNNHVIDEPYLDKNKNIELSINNNKIEKIIKIDNRRVYTNKLYDTTIIEIFEEKDDIKDFLDIDFDLNGEILKNQYTNKSIYVLQYPKNEKVSVSYGIIKNIDLSNNYDILHLCSTDIGSSGSPIFNILSNKIIGIHKGASNTKKFNKGTLLFFPLKEFLSKIKNKTLINNVENSASLSKIQKKKQLIQNKHYKSPREELENSPLTNNCYDMLKNGFHADNDKEIKPINPKCDKIGLFKVNSLSGQKILIVMLWSCALSEFENKLLDPKNVEETNEFNSKCIKNTVDYLGVKVKTVLNYEDAIKEITDKDKNGKCNYYTVWVMCGPDINKLPDFSKYPGLVEQFIDCLILYWQNGGSVVLFCSGDPLYFQANMFLEKIRFKGKVNRTKLRITGNDKGTGMLRGFNGNGNLIGKGIYDTSTIRLPNGTERMPLGRNVPQIYEGENISHANSNNNEDIKPFIPFAKNTSGNICIMIYCTQGKEGDIIIDCGYTKVFINMSTEDIETWRYIQNLAGFLARPEAHMIYDDGETAKNYRPNGVNFKINYSNLYKKLRNYNPKGNKNTNKKSNLFNNNGTNELDIVYMIDSTGSMSSWINGVKDKCKEILDKLNENIKLRDYDIRFGGVFYRDPVDSYGDIHEYQPLGDVNNLKIKLMSIEAEGGGDAPEDWVGGYEIALNKNYMKWRDNSIKIIIHIADAGAHTLRFSDGDIAHNDYKYEKGLVDLIETCARENISIFGYQIGTLPQKSFSECKSIYDSVKSTDCYFEIYQFEHASDEVVSEKLKENITIHISAFMEKK